MKKLHIVFLLAAGLLIAAYFFVRFYLQADIRHSRNNARDSASAQNADSTLDLRPLFIAKIQQLVSKGSKGLYSIAINNMDIDMLKSRVTLTKVQLHHDSSVLAALDSLKMAPDDVFIASFDTLKIVGINLDDVLTQKAIDFSEIRLVSPVIEAYHTKRPYSAAKTVDSITLFDRIMKDMKSIAIGKLVIENGTFISHNKTKKNKKNVLKTVELEMTDILIDSTTEHATDRFLFARQASLALRNYEMRTADDIYFLRIGLLTVRAPQKTMTIDNLSFASQYNQQQFQKKHTRQKEQYDFSAPKITLHNIDWWSFMQQDRFVADELVMHNAKLKIRLDRSLPRPLSKMGNFPQQVVMKLPIRIDVGVMKIRNLDLLYQEYNPISTQTGSIHLDRLNLDISNITNIPSQIKKKKQTVATGTALFKDIPVKARFVFDLVNHKKGRFSASLTTGSFEGKKMNDIAQPLGLLKIEKGYVTEFNIAMQGDEHHASGKIMMLYNDFKIALYEKEKDEKGLDKKGLLGFFANAFVIKNDNPSKNEISRNPAAEFQRDPQAGFFNLVWKTALTGILKTIGANPSMAENKAKR
ncbi:MAG: hypothetical protein H7122_17430 [Chitinophagaceae bacterium]|nr:hypothetical protein [Chitinophagaceae bacterium]